MAQKDPGTITETGQDGTGSVPLVSICIPAYNRADMIGKAIESALAQTFTGIEVLVVDNASTDATGEVVARYHDPRLRYVRNPANLGLFGNFNRCIELARGKYIHILHSDDYIDSRFTETCVAFFASHPEVAMTFSSVVVESGESRRRLDVADGDRVYPAPEGFREILARRNFINCPTAVLRRDVYETLGPYSGRFPYAADLQMWLLVSRRYAIAYVHDALLYYRQGEHSESFRQLFRSPSGYLDPIGIFIDLADAAPDEVRQFLPEYNAALRRHMGDCIFAGITRAGSIAGYGPSVFFGFALTCRALVRPESFSASARKCADLLLIGVLWLLASVPGVRSCLKRAVLFGKSGY